MMKNASIACDQCQLQTCFRDSDNPNARWPTNCPTVKFQTALDENMDDYRAGQTRTLAMGAWDVNRIGKRDWTRLQATIGFAQRCGFEHLGLAFCIGLMNESATLGRVLRRHGFKVSAVPCSIGSPDWPSVGINNPSRACNPSGQALILNHLGAELNIVLGLCVGDDSIFFLKSEAPCVALACKDKVLAHHPISALYVANSYHEERLTPPLMSEE